MSFRPSLIVLASLSAFVLNASAFAANDGSSAKASGNLAGTITATNNPQVAQYTIKSPQTGTWFVSFGPTTAYGRTTSVQPIANPNKPTSMYIAGMLPETTYHMQASVQSADGTTVVDQDRTFTTGTLPTGFPYSLPITLGPTGTPQPGVELIDNISGSMPSGFAATDLQGNVIWTYANNHPNQGPFLYPVKLLPNGDFLCFVATSGYPVGGKGSNILREFDLAGNTVRETSIQQVNAGLSQLGFTGKLATFNHDLALLPTGHTLIMANQERQFTDLPGYPGTTDVTGDVIVDLDQNWNPVWFWNEFDHLDVNRHPMFFPDWTHSNSIAYSPDDGNFLVSIRHQNWVVKVDYRNGQGTGNILWKLGEGGDFKLVGGVDPTDWFYAQHDAQFVGSPTAGVFTLSVMDNGDDRIFPNGCGSGTQPPCLYSTIQLLQMDETAKTATFQIHQILPPNLYNGWGGNVEVLANGDIEYDLTATPGGAQIFEVTNSNNPLTVWNEQVQNNSAYRAFRLPSLYPGVQW